MNKSKQIITLGLGSLMALSGLNSCNDDNETPDFAAVSDVYMQKITVDDQEKYAPVFYVYANRNLKEVSVIAPGEEEKTYTLEKNGENSNLFVWNPTDEDFTTEKTEEGDYTFTITSSKDELLQGIDKLTEDEIDAIKIDKFDYEASTHSFDISWNEIEDAKVYVVKIITKEDKDQLYISTGLDENSLEFDEQTYGWSQNIEVPEGTECILEVYAYHFEDQKNPSWYHIQMECIDSREFNW